MSRLDDIIIERIKIGTFEIIFNNKQSSLENYKECNTENKILINDDAKIFEIIKMVFAETWDELFQKYPQPDNVTNERMY